MAQLVIKGVWVKESCLEPRLVRAYRYGSRAPSAASAADGADGAYGPYGPYGPFGSDLALDAGDFFCDEEYFVNIIRSFVHGGLAAVHRTHCALHGNGCAGIVQTTYLFFSFIGVVELWLFGLRVIGGHRPFGPSLCALISFSHCRERRARR